MKFFIDTAKLDEIREAHSLGLVDGVTTNPSLCAKIGIGTKEDFKEHIRTICELVQGPVSAEVVATESDAMVAEARELANVLNNPLERPVKIIEERRDRAGRIS